MNSRLLVVLWGIFAAIQPVQAMFAPPQPMPLERLLKKAETYSAAHPESAEGRYIIARIHYLAFARASLSIPTYGINEDGKPVILPDAMIQSRIVQERYEEASRLAFRDIGVPGPDVPRAKETEWAAARHKHHEALRASGWRPAKELSDEQLAIHAVAALRGFRELVSKDPRNGLYHLGLASLSEQIVRWKKNRAATGMPDALKAVQIDDACSSYLAAHLAAFPEDSKVKEQPLLGLRDLVSYEAGQGFVRLVEAGPRPNVQFSRALPQVKASLARIEKLPRGAITPILFAMRPVAGIDELLAPEIIVDFDLRGFGPRERSTWIKADTALLVWDPEKRGVISSGQQLFGGYTFQLFRANGYDALAALDDDGDGTLAGAELDGIRAWFDTNADGRSAPNEVRDLSDLGVVGIATGITHRDGRHPASAKGLLLRDGSALPTWDWISQPINELR